MATAARDLDLAKRLANEIVEFIDAEVEHLGTTEASKPGHRVPFHWPPHPISYNYHVLASDWRGSINVEIEEESFQVLLAKTPYGVFGRCDALWIESRGRTQSEMVQNMREAVKPLFDRQREIAGRLGLKGRFQGSIGELDSLGLLKLLLSKDRDVASQAQTTIESRPGKPTMLPALLAILRDERHPNRRSAQWCVLDLFEDLPSYCIDEADEIEAIGAMKELIRNATDDYARTIYKAGVVLGGHIPDLHGGPALVECLDSPSRIARRSAIHGLFHVAEWHPELKEEVVRALQRSARLDPDPQLRSYADHMAQDVASGQIEHVEDPVFDDED